MHVFVKAKRTRPYTLKKSPYCLFVWVFSFARFYVITPPQTKEKSSLVKKFFHVSLIGVSLLDWKGADVVSVVGFKNNGRVSSTRNRVHALPWLPLPLQFFFQTCYYDVQISFFGYRITFAYGSQTGAAKSIAEELQEEAESKEIRSELLELNQLRRVRVGKQRLLND